ncbi:pyridoxal phosphate-dependent decarboxylase family protein [Hyalangium rubrum]|uniref:Aspartate aminotransferase family protein n=1 Tax=Hyalangium rubrum TaxID=3103134 RepID=A0ABU5HH17_9BACT|nr:aspartate aminotransferase family protein [Hyalangium sp. s54d21]MDY7232545.1 aspartate aminotransferase family protein [Hyalangium sp. s54d21]
MTTAVARKPVPQEELGPDLLERLFVCPSEKSQASFQAAISTALKALEGSAAWQKKPYSGASPEVVRKAITAMDPCPEEGRGLEAVMKDVREAILQHSVWVSHPATVAHLHCPTLVPALAAETLISATNQSMDSWDQAPAATVVEQQVVKWLGKLAGFGAGSDGVFTSGGTLSNFMGLLLARNHFCQEKLNWDVQQEGLPLESHRLRILCSQKAHFSVVQAAALLGLGESAVVAVESDERHRLDPQALARYLEVMRYERLLPFAVVATAGTTDFGSIDPLPAISELARKHGAWLHVDAAYGGALLLSERFRDRLQGLSLADSVTIDFHKLFYQPVSCGAFLVRDGALFRNIKLNVDYLNPEDEEEAGVDNLVTKSVQTTRRFDALKVFVSLQSLGRRTLASLVEYTVDLTSDVADLISATPELELAGKPELNAVVFRYRPSRVKSQERLDQLNASIRDVLWNRGMAVVGRTRVNGVRYLKFTLLNPRTTRAHVAGLLEDVRRIGRELEEANHG